MSIAKQRAADGDAIAEVLKTHEIVCDCGHSGGCENQAVAIQRDDIGTVWTLCEECYEKCT